MKFNWGTGIFLFYTIFAGSLFYQVYKSTQYDNSLVAENYYEKDLAYQSMYDRKMNSLRLENPMSIEYYSEINSVEFLFPKDLKAITGKILFYRASDEKLDMEFPIQLNELNEMKISTENFKRGRWTAEVEWDSGEKGYFDKKILGIKSTP
jgi:nitrogen fixation protein FixH